MRLSFFLSLFCCNIGWKRFDFIQSNFWCRLQKGGRKKQRGENCRRESEISDERKEERSLKEGFWSWLLAPPPPPPLLHCARAAFFLNGLSGAKRARLVPSSPLPHSLSHFFPSRVEEEKASPSELPFFFPSPLKELATRNRLLPRLLFSSSP